MRDLERLYAAGRVKRYHTADVPAQSLASHSWGVAMIVAMIYPKPHAVPSNILMAALTHDLAESYTGDLPATIKWGNPVLATYLVHLENEFDTLHDLKSYPGLSQAELRILHWADTFELCMYCRHCFRMGNIYANEILARGLAHLQKNGFPTTEAKELYNDIFGG